MNSSITVKINPARFDLGNAKPMFDIAGWLGSLAKRVFAPQAAAQTADAESVEHLLALADAYAETQPSYAADLRAAAMSYDASAGRRID